jgi:cytochrome c oxidase subunit 2
MALYLAPSIAGQDAWYIEGQLRRFRDGARGVHPEDVPGMRMRPMSMWLAKDEDLVAVAQYVASMPSVSPEPTLEGTDVAKGKATYALCQACHGAAGEGMQPLNAPKLTGVSDWYLVSQLERFKSGVRGTNPNNPISALMRPMAMSLTDEQAMKDVAAYIMTLSN